MEKNKYMISEAAKMVHVESHVLRYWEDELDLKIGRNDMGHRYYTKDDIQLFCCIKKLKDEGMLLKDLKSLIPELTKTRSRLLSRSGETLPFPETALRAQASDKPAKQLPQATAASVPDTVSDPVPDPGLREAQVRSLIGEVFSEVIKANNEALKNDISKTVVADVTRELDYLLQAKERREEEHFRKLDSLIRQQQANRREAQKPFPALKFKKRFLF